MKYPRKLERLEDLIGRLNRDIRFDYRGIKYAVDVVSRVNTEFDISNDILPHCLLLIHEDQGHLEIGSRIGTIICGRDRKLDLFNKISALFYLADRNEPISNHDWHIKRVVARSQNKTITYPNAEIANQCGRLLFKALADPDFPQEMMGREDKLRCFEMAARTIVAHGIKLQAIEAMVTIAREDYWPEEISAFVKTHAMRFAVSHLEKDTKLGAEALRLLDRFEGRAIVGSDPESHTPVGPVTTKVVFLEAFHAGNPIAHKPGSPSFTS